ncbi:MAG: hypothetical protein HRU11_05730 [Parvularculaceae bacterium]|nr:hypothetical protein [Parvularculaceae bacterium]
MMETQTEIGVTPDLPAAEVAETSQAAPTWPLIAVLAIAMLLARAPATKKQRSF